MVAAANIVARPAVPGDAALVEPFVDRCARGRRRPDPNSLVASASPIWARPTTHATPPTTHATPRALSPLRRSTHLYGRFDVVKLIETAAVAVVAVDPARDDLVVGFLAVSHQLPTPFGVSRDKGMARVSWATSEAAAMGHPPAWIAGCAVSDGYQSTAVAPMLRACFLAHPHLDLLLLAASPEVERQPLGKHLAKLAKTTRFALYAAPRAVVAPRLRVRRARVEDHDDLVPLYAVVAADPSPPGGALSRVPAVAAAADDARGGPEEEYALARLIDAALAEPERHCVLVAEIGDTGKFAGVMALSADGVDAEALARDHDVSSYDDLRTDADADADAEEKEKKKAKEKDAGTTGSDSSPTEDAPPELEPSSPDEDPSSSSSPPPSSSSTRANAFRVTMLAVLPEYLAQSPEFLDVAFECFPDKDHCVLSVPPHVPQVPLAAAAMRRAAPRNARANDALYVCHRAGRLPGFEVRVADDMDSDSIEELLEGMEDADEMVLAFNDAVEARERGEAAAVVATCEGTVVGYATFALEVDLEPLAACFDLAEVIHLDAHDADGYAQLEECVMNPVFAHARKTVVTEALRLLRKTCALYQLAPGDDQPPPPEVVTSDFRLVAGRRSREDFDAHFALFAFTPRVAVTPRTAVNARVVVVGGSEAALATVDRLVTHPGTAFNNITLVTSGALAVGGAASAYNRASLAKLALENGGGVGGGVATVEASLRALDRDARVVVLDDDTELPYEMLVLCPAHEDQTRRAMDAASHLPVERLRDVLGALTREDASSLTSVVVYGDTFEAMGAPRALIAAGVAPSAIHRVSPASPTENRGVSALVASAAAATPGLGPETLVAEGQPATREGLTFAGAEPLDVGARAYFRGETDDDVVAIDAEFVVTCDEGDVDPATFRCLNDAGIVFDGNVVVDAAFRTNDPDVYAGGDVAKFSRRLGVDVAQTTHRDPMEVGRKLADAIIARATGRRTPTTAPELVGARAECVTFPGGARFARAAAPATRASRDAVSPPPGGRAVTSVAGGEFCRLDVDATDTIVAFSYLGANAVDPRRFARLVGLPASLLELDAFERDAATDPDAAGSLMTRLNAPHLAAVYHDGFAATHAALMTTLRRGADAADFAHPLGPNTVAEVAQETALDFLARTANDFPTGTYVLPARAAA